MRTLRRAVRATALATAVATAALAPRQAAAQAAVAPAVAAERPRFEILSVGDSTFTFAVGSRDWVRARLRGEAVDPRRRNALVARFEVMSVNGSVATALITGETTRVAVGNVALIDEPPQPFYRKRSFWGGVLAGAVVGAGLTAALK